MTNRFDKWVARQAGKRGICPLNGSKSIRDNDCFRRGLKCDLAVRLNGLRARSFDMSRSSSLELLEYARLTLRLIEQSPHRDEDALIASELKLALRRYIAELKRRQPAGCSTHTL